MRRRRPRPRRPRRPRLAHHQHRARSATAPNASTFTQSVAAEFTRKMTAAMKADALSAILSPPGNRDGSANGNKRQLETSPATPSQAAVKQGAKLVMRRQGGRPPAPATTTSRPCSPTAGQEMRHHAARRSSAPSCPSTTFDNLDQAIELANDCEYGLTSSIYTRSSTSPWRRATNSSFGETYINRENFEAMQGFHAGWRKSGIGGADGKHGLLEDTSRPTSSTFRTEPPGVRIRMPPESPEASDMDRCEPKARQSRLQGAVLQGWRRRLTLRAITAKAASPACPGTSTFSEGKRDE